MMSKSIAQRLERKATRKTIEDARRRFGLNYVELSSALQVDRHTLLRYRKETSTPLPRVRKRMERLREISQLLDEVFGTPEARTAWLHGSVPMLRGRRPIDLMGQGELDDVLSVLAGLHSGTFI